MLCLVHKHGLFGHAQTTAPPLLQARTLLHLGRPLDVAERGLVFVQTFLQLLAEREAAGQLRPWFKEVRGCQFSHADSGFYFQHCASDSWCTHGN